MTTDFPGARWWKFDLHTHTPASHDFGKGPRQAEWMKTSPSEWLLAFMRAGVDCVVVTDHNSAGWINSLRSSLKEVEAQGHPDYRALDLFPGVEITASGGVHILGAFDPSCDATTVEQLIGRARIRGTAQQAASELSPLEVVREIGDLGGVPILAHADGPNGAFALNGTTLRQLLDEPHLLACEICDPKAARPALLADRKRRWAEVVGSDSHHLDGSVGKSFPGSHFTWIKMARPSIEGLRLALLDGNELSVRRSDQVKPDFDPNRPPDDWVESVEIADAKVMGRGQAERIEFSPFLNALVGGRGTGKSTVVHFMRAALRRSDELDKLDEESEPRAAFTHFFRTAASRSDVGGLTETTSYRLVYRHGGKRFRVTAAAKSPTVVEEEVGAGEWRTARSQEVKERFPARVFSQGQVHALAGHTSAALLEIVDENAGLGESKRALAEERNRFMALRSRSRELRQKLAATDRVRAQLEDVRHKLAKFEATQHAAILKDHQRRSRQTREIESQVAEGQGFAARIEELAGELASSDPAPGLFEPGDPVDERALEALLRLRGAIEAARTDLRRAAAALRAALAETLTTSSEGPLAEAARAAQQRYQGLAETLRAEGVSDPSQFGVLVQDRQRLEGEEKELVALEARVQEVVRDGEASLRRLAELRRAISVRRRDYLVTALAGNRFVQIEVVEYGRDSLAASLSLREAIGVNDDRFANDLPIEGEEVGLTHDLFASLPEGEAAIPAIEDRLYKLKEGLAACCEGADAEGFGGHLQNFLQREHARRPELSDRILAWFPEDVLRVQYSARGDGKSFKPIHQASAGQKAAAMLAFFLAHGTEPIVLDQPEDDLDNHLIYELVVQQLRDSKQRRQIIAVTHNPNIVVNGDADFVHAFDFVKGQCKVTIRGSLQEQEIRDEVCRVMEGGRQAFLQRYRRLAERDGDA